MCGITGIFDIYHPFAIEEVILKRMTHALNHRGPDSTSLYLDQEAGLGFGFRRLSIIDLSDDGNQPFFNADKSVVMICNGEIYNYKELRAELEKKGFHFTSHCDVEVIPHLYEAYGKEFIKMLNGQFAFALFDKKENMVMLGRDHFGICPMFYHLRDGALLFGSEIKALLQHPFVRREVDFTGLDQVFSFPGLVSPSTMFKNVRSLKPGHMAIIKDGQSKEFEYWDLDYTGQQRETERKEDYYIEKLEDLLIRSVRYRMNADVPVGFYLSGGLDSSLVGAIMRHIDPHTSFNSFSISFPRQEDREHNESQYQF
jgi:asparagine synthase (glutamine-hydrolysing)